MQLVSKHSSPCRMTSARLIRPLIDDAGYQLNQTHYNTQLCVPMSAPIHSLLSYLSHSLFKQRPQCVPTSLRHVEACHPWPPTSLGPAKPGTQQQDLRLRLDQATVLSCARVSTKLQTNACPAKSTAPKHVQCRNCCYTTLQSRPHPRAKIGCQPDHTVLRQAAHPRGIAAHCCDVHAYLLRQASSWNT